MRGQVPEPGRVLVSDIDGTLLRDGEPTRGLDRLRRRLSAHRSALRLVYATGRSFESTWSLVKQGVLPRPDAVAAFVGTEIWLPPWKISEPGYDGLLASGWDREAVLDAAGLVSGLELQPACYQSWCKVSYFVRNAHSVDHLHRELDLLGTSVRMIHSHDLYLDLIPKKAGKSNAVKHLLELWDMQDAQVLVAGDSGNDRDMISEPEFQGVAVGNCEQDLREACDSAPDTFISSAAYAGGVLEGAEAHDFWP
jgi:sucrose-6F-phosphate phosphohydrolase